MLKKKLNMSEYELYLNVILEMIEKIENSIKNLSKEQFLKKEESMDATLMRLQVIGENVKSIPLKIKKTQKEFKWRKFEKLRNFISHKYSQIDEDIIWEIIQKDLIKLKSVIENIKNEN